MASDRRAVLPPLHRPLPAGSLAAPTRRLPRPRTLKALWRLVRHYGVDLVRYARGSSTIVGDVDRQRLEAKLTINYHRIEKGLALPSPRPGFGQPHVAGLIADTTTYLNRYGPADIINTIVSTLIIYRDFNKVNGMHFECVETFINYYKNEIKAAAGGTLRVSRKDIERKTAPVSADFFLSRHSIRQFAPGDITDGQLDEAVRLAQHAPSVCNRQAGRIYLVSGASMAACLRLQNGNRGFGQQLARLAVITSDLRNFVSVGERNQCWIDGGLFAMTFCYALHAQSLGTCMLNWSVEQDKDDALRRLIGIPDHEVVVMMMGIGKLTEEFDVARSRRRDLEEVRRFIRSGEHDG